MHGRDGSASHYPRDQRHELLRVSGWLGAAVKPVDVVHLISRYSDPPSRVATRKSRLDSDGTIGKRRFIVSLTVSNL